MHVTLNEQLNTRRVHPGRHVVDASGPEWMHQGNFIVVYLGTGSRIQKIVECT